MVYHNIYTSFYSFYFGLAFNLGLNATRISKLTFQKSSNKAVSLALVNKHTCSSLSLPLSLFISAKCIANINKINFKITDFGIHAFY